MTGRGWAAGLARPHVWACRHCGMVEDYRLLRRSNLARVFPQRLGNSPRVAPAYGLHGCRILENFRESGTPHGTSVALGVHMITKERVESVLARVRPYMQADGGDIELLALDGNSAEVRLTGMCAACPSAHMTLYLGVETALREEMPEFETLRLR